MANNVPPMTTTQTTRQEAKAAGRHEAGKEFEFTRADFERVRGLIYQRADRKSVV